MNKHVVGFLFLLVVLTGCSSKGKMEAYAEEQIKELYGIDVIVTNIERSNSKIPTLFAVFGDYYQLTFETTGEQSFVFNGSIHSGDFNQFNDNYISSKHEYLLQHNPHYNDLYEKLEMNGFTEMELTSGFTKNVQINVLFTGEYNGEKFNVAELTETMNRMAEMLIPEKPFETSIAFAVNAKQYTIDTMDEIPLEFSIYSYHLPSTENFSNALTSQITAFQSNQAVTDELVKQLHDLRFDISSRLNREITNSIDQRSYTHKIGLLVLEEYDETRLLKAIDILRNAGMDEAYVRLIFQEGSTAECQVKELKDNESITKCFS